ncbi:MAG: hypothetical protein ABGY41_15570 [Candidatus Poribacteria bacterium]|jgi:peptidoglycan hydrolase CwlO-like protein
MSWIIWAIIAMAVCSLAQSFFSYLKARHGLTKGASRKQLAEMQQQLTDIQQHLGKMDERVADLTMLVGDAAQHWLPPAGGTSAEER